jgi:hypothetical protein
MGVLRDAMPLFQYSMRKQRIEVAVKNDKTKRPEIVLQEHRDRSLLFLW